MFITNRAVLKRVDKSVSEVCVYRLEQSTLITSHTTQLTRFKGSHNSTYTLTVYRILLQSIEHMLNVHFFHIENTHTHTHTQP